MDDIITFVGIAFVLVFTVVAGYCCIIKGARQDEINQKDYEEYCRLVGDDDESVYNGDE